MPILSRPAFVAALLFFVLAPAARAQTTNAKAEAQAALREGNALLAHGHAAEALAKFKSAYALFPSPKLHYNIGQAESLIAGHEAQAYDAMSRFLSQAKDANPDLRAAAEKQRQHLRSKVGVVAVVADPPDAQLVVDGAPVGASERAEELVLGIGVHALVLRGDAATSPTEQVTIAGGETKVVRLRLPAPVAVAPPAQPAPPPVTPPTLAPSASPPTSPQAPSGSASAPEPAPLVVVSHPAPQPEPSAWTPSRMVGAALVALGAVSLVFGVVEHIRYFNKADEFEHNGCGTNDLSVGKGCRGLNDDFNSAKAMWIAGYAGALAVGGLGTYLIWPRVEPASGERGGGTSVSSLTINLAAHF
jgi:hypothetical protein